MTSPDDAVKVCLRCHCEHSVARFPEGGRICRWCRDDIEAGREKPPTGALPVLQIEVKPVSEGAEPYDVFRCEPLSARLTYRACIARQTAKKTYATGGKARSRVLHDLCANRCPQGPVIRAAFPAVGPVGVVNAYRSPPRLDLIHPNPETKMSEEKKTCPHCGKALRSDNTRGACSACLAKPQGARKTGEASSPPVEKQEAPPKKRPGPVPIGPRPSGLQALSNTDLRDLLSQVLGEVRRRVAELEELRTLAAPFDGSQQRDNSEAA